MMPDINQEQRRASNPLSSVWVSASAGSGKTKVLTDRVLNLLLLTGKPDKILCLTYTKAAAAEMANRVGDVLKKWAICPETDLVTEIQNLSGETPDANTIAKARRLFAEVLETPGGMKIMTIHSFCQSVLRRFPLEAGVPPNFQMMDDLQAEAILNDILDEVLAKQDFQKDVTLLSEHQTPEQMVALLKALFAQRGKLMALRQKSSLKTIVVQIKQALGIEKYDTETDIIADRFDPEMWPDIQKKYLVKSGVAHSKKAHLEEAQIAEEVEQNIRNLKLVNLTEALLRLSYGILEHFQNKKSAMGLLEQEDSIAATKKLLESGHAASWVLFKLDGGIDHILVDEAQDTNPDQWAIIRLLAEEFFAGEDHHETLRTIFAVGDKKQSIYSFQGAKPAEFERMRHFFENRIKASQNEFETVPFNLSFRSTQPILDVVNHVLSYPPARQGILDASEEAVHLPYRTGQAGLVEVWPLVPYVKPVAPEPWKPPVETIHHRSAQSLLAQQIATKIADMIQNQEILPSKGRPVEAGDFLILVQKRNDFMTELVRLLKERNIPVAGIDRMNLSTHIAIQDLMAAARFALLPEDDLNLACLLKSPLMHLTEEELFTAAYGRGKESLWIRVERLFPREAARLTTLLNLADKVPPYEFFATILGPMGGREAFLARFGHEAIEAIDEFLNLVLNFEKNAVPSLQGFIDAVSARDKIEVKRDMESGQNAVRIMTVHGSKGLQGNIVFLPQTRYMTFRRPPFIWLNDELPLWIPNQTMNSQATEALTQEALTAVKNENRRLLYVALTRAKDRLYICGAESGKPAPEGNWYDLITEALKDYTPDSDGIIRITSEQEKQIAVSHRDTLQAESPLPDWAHKPAPDEPAPPKPLSPSKPAAEEPAEESPLSAERAAALERGTFIHRLLQYLPDVAPENWDTVIKRLKPPQIEVPSGLKDLLLSPQLAPLFGPGSLAEVPVVGVWQGQAVSGQIDRLVVLPEKVMVVDFKTNRRVPKTVAEVPTLYRQQLAAYRGLLQQIFPDKVVKTYLLWTEDITLMEVPDET